MRLAHLLSAAALLVAPLAMASTASAGPAKDWTSKVPTTKISKVGPFDCGARPCNYKVEKVIPKKPDPGPLRVPGKVGRGGL